MKSQLIDELIFFQRDFFLKESVDHQPGTFPKEFIRLYVTKELNKEGKEQTLVEFQVWVQESSLTNPRLTGRGFKADVAILPRLIESLEKARENIGK